jgi:hypothetical protein
MKACRVHHFGPPDVIPFENVARPHPGEGEVLIRVKGGWSWAFGCPEFAPAKAYSRNRFR